MNDRAAIKYKGFWDVPRIFITRYRGQTFLFDCAFDEGLDDYPENYKVFLLPDIEEEKLPRDWTFLQTKAIGYLGEIPVARVQFDSSRRQSIDTGILDELSNRRVAAE